MLKRERPGEATVKDFLVLIILTLLIFSVSHSSDLLNGAQEKCELPPLDGFPHCEGKLKVNLTHTHTHNWLFELKRSMAGSPSMEDIEIESTTPTRPHYLIDGSSKKPPSLCSVFDSTVMQTGGAAV